MIDYTKDSHIHTNYSPDADKTATFKAYINKAIELGLTEITFTDHVDFDAVHPLFHEMIDYDEYIKEFEIVKKDSPIQIKLGVEIGYQKHMKDKINTFLKKYSFDYVILSIHYIDKKDLYTQEFFKGKTKKEAYKKYFDTCIDAINDISLFDAFGHLDYITRYSGLGGYSYLDYKDQIDSILRLLISKGKTIEINTSGFRYEDRTYPNPVIIQRFLELGGTSIKLGSDAHNVNDLAHKFNDLNENN